MSGDGRDRPATAGEPSAEESLDEALNHLERMLEGREGSQPDRPTSAPAEHQYEIPMLDEVVLPGAESEPTPFPTPDHEAEESEELSRRVAERLASEIEIIVNDSIERAIAEALADAQARIRDHLAIVLPEIVEELRLARRVEQS